MLGVFVGGASFWWESKCAILVGFRSWVVELSFGCDSLKQKVNRFIYCWKKRADAECGWNLKTQLDNVFLSDSNQSQERVKNTVLKSVIWEDESAWKFSSAHLQAIEDWVCLPECLLVNNNTTKQQSQQQACTNSFSLQTDLLNDWQQLGWYHRVWVRSSWWCFAR